MSAGARIGMLLIAACLLAVGFALGAYWQRSELAAVITHSGTAATTTDAGGSSVVGAGEHCGGFIRNASVCGNGYRCELTAGRPDVGGTCVPDTASSTLPSWTNGMVVITPAAAGTTVHLSKNERFAVMLGSALAWNVSFTPAGAVTRVANSIDTGGFQGVYEADVPGTATLSAEGRVACAPGALCPQFIREVRVTLVIAP